MIKPFMKKLSAFSYLKDLERLDWSKSDPSIKTVKDINYIDDHSIDHQLDIYYKDNHKPKPIMIDIHGGGFISAYKEVDALFANFLAQRGFVVFALNYRLAYPKYNVFDQIHDISNTLQWIVSNAHKYGANTNEMYITGHSAGGYLALTEVLLCHDEKMRADFNIGQRNYHYKGLILDCGALHLYQKNIAYWGMRSMIFPKGYEHMDQYPYLIFENNRKLSSLPKTVLLTNKKDEIKAMTYHFKSVLETHNVDHRLYDGGSAGHMGIIFEPYTEEHQKVLDDIQAYFEI